MRAGISGVSASSKLNTLLDTKKSQPSKIGKVNRLSRNASPKQLEIMAGKGYKEIAAAGGSVDRVQEDSIAHKLARGKYLTTEDQKQAEAAVREQRAVHNHERRQKARQTRE